MTVVGASDRAAKALEAMRAQSPRLPTQRPVNLDAALSKVQGGRARI